LKHPATTEAALELNLLLPPKKISITSSSSQVRMMLLAFKPNLTELHHPKQNLNFQGLIIKTLVQCILIQVITKKAKEYYLKAREIQKAVMGNPIDAIWAVTYVQALPNCHNQILSHILTKRI
jgi:hypothetical protein